MVKHQYGIRAFTIDYGRDVEDLIMSGGRVEVS